MKDAGYIVIADPDAPRPIEAATAQCCHCNKHFQKARGAKTSGCSRCGSVTCGRAKCIPCKPFLAQLDEIERRATLTQRYGI